WAYPRRGSARPTGRTTSAAAPRWPRCRGRQRPYDGRVVRHRPVNGEGTGFLPPQGCAMPEEIPPWVRRYGVALLCVAVVLIVRWPLELLLGWGPRHAYITFFPALMVAGYIGRPGPRP